MIKRVLLSVCLMLGPVWIGSLSQVDGSHVLTGTARWTINLGSSVYAAERRRERRRVPPVRESTFKVLQEAQELIDPERARTDNPDDPPPDDLKPDPHGALELLNEAKERRGLNSYEIAQIWNIMAYAYYTLEDPDNTIRAYKEVLKGEGVISLALELSTLRALFQLYLMREDLDLALTYIEKWEKVNVDPEPDMIYFKGYISLQKGNNRRALRYALEIETVAKALERKMKEDWWYLQVILYNQKKDYDNVIKVLEKLIVHYPKKQYWVHLVGMYNEKGREDAALSAAYAAYTQDMFTKESELVVLSQRLLNAEVPYEASQVLEKGLKKGYVKESEKTMKLLAQAYTMSKEMGKAIGAWRKATKYAEDGELYYRLAQALSNEDKHKEAVKAFRNALKKGDLKKPADVSFWLGVSLMQLENWDESIEAFEKTAEMDEEQAERCGQYIAYIKSEKRRLKAIDDMLNA